MSDDRAGAGEPSPPIEEPKADQPATGPSPAERLPTAQTPLSLHHGARASRLGALLVVAILLVGLLRGLHGGTGLAPGTRLPPFAVPLALGDVTGEADIATQPNEGSAGKHPACTVRGPGILNICELYERGPVVLALFVDAGSCPGILDELQALARSFGGVGFAAVALRGDRGSLQRLIRAHHLTLPIGIDREGRLAALYQFATCPQVTFAYRGGVVQGHPLLVRPTLAVLRSRAAELLSAQHLRG